MSRSLTSNERHLMRLILKGRNAEGWAPVSHVVMPLASELAAGLPELVEVKSDESKAGWGLARLTEAGETVIAWS